MIIEVSVAPRSAVFSMSFKDNRLRVHVTSPPEGNKANLELLQGLSAALGAPVRLVSGATSRRKKLDIGISPEAWAAFLAKAGRKH